MIASKNGYTEIVQLLLNTLREADTDILLEALNHSNGDDTALSLALYHGQTQIVQLLLNTLHEAGVNILLALNDAIDLWVDLAQRRVQLLRLDGDATPAHGAEEAAEGVPERGHSSDYLDPRGNRNNSIF